VEKSIPFCDLIYDVGMHNGDDSAFNLRQGFKVVAVEADPQFSERARQTFGSPSYLALGGGLSVRREVAERIFPCLKKRR
jgi:hypothetical protein